MCKSIVAIEAVFPINHNKLAKGGQNILSKSGSEGNQPSLSNITWGFTLALP